MPTTGFTCRLGWEIHPYETLVDVLSDKCACVPTCIQELAEQQGDVEKVAHLTEQLESLEERADHLDKQRTKGLSAIRFACCPSSY